VEIPSATARGTVLVVDDDVEIGISLRRVLREHDVTAVASAQEALDRLEAGARYNLILSDVMMPGMSGVELYEVITRRFPELTSRIVFISGGAFTTGAMAFLERVPNERLEKPFTLRSLRALVARYTGGSRREAES
jgi:CheY-like chemotaxis protein